MVDDNLIGFNKVKQFDAEWNKQMTDINYRICLREIGVFRIKYLCMGTTTTKEKKSDTLING